MPMTDNIDPSITYDPKTVMPPKFCDAYVFGRANGALIVFRGMRAAIDCATDEDYRREFLSLLCRGYTIMDVYDGTICKPNHDLPPEGCLE